MGGADEDFKGEEGADARTEPGALVDAEVAFQELPPEEIWLYMLQFIRRSWWAVE